MIHLPEMAMAESGLFGGRLTYVGKVALDRNRLRRSSPGHDARIACVALPPASNEDGFYLRDRPCRVRFSAAGWLVCVSDDGVDFWRSQPNSVSLRISTRVQFSSRPEAVPVQSSRRQLCASPEAVTLFRPQSAGLVGRPTTGTP
jgi:hypothetical protein